MSKPSAKRVVTAYYAERARALLAVADDIVSSSRQGHNVRTAGEVRFIKDRSGDSTEWAWNSHPPSEREINEEYEYDPKALEPLASSLRSVLMSLGHAMSGYTTFTKIKSRTVSPDGSLGGRGYIMKISDMRRQLMNCIEVLSSVSDTIYDEVNAPHWTADSGAPGKRERDEVKEIMEDVDDIRRDPEEWANEEEAEMDEESEQKGMADQLGKTASLTDHASLLARQYMSTRLNHE